MYILYNKKEDYQYHIINDINTNNNLNEHLMNDDSDETYQVFSIDDENMIRSIIEENKILLQSCEIEINNSTNNETKNNQSLINDKEVEKVLNSSI